MSARARTHRFGMALLALAFAALAVIPARAAARQSCAPRAIQLTVEVKASAPQDEDFTRTLADAYALVAAGRHEEAARLFSSLLDRRPNDSAALYGAALSTFNVGRAADAEPLARRAVEAAQAARRKSSDESVASPALNSRAADALVLLAVILAVRGDHAGSLSVAREAVTIAPAHFDAQFTLGRALYGAGDDAGAARAFRTATALRPADPRPLFFLATVLERAGDGDGALAAYRELSAKNPGAVEGHLGLGALLVRRGGRSIEEGMKSLARALEINPNIYEARVTLGRALVARGRAAEAIEHLKRAAELAPANPEPHYQLSLAYRRLGRAREAAAESEIVRKIHESRRSSGARNTKPATP